MKCQYPDCNEGHYPLGQNSFQIEEEDGWRTVYGDVEWGACPCCGGPDWENCPKCYAVESPIP